MVEFKIRGSHNAHSFPHTLEFVLSTMVADAHEETFANPIRKVSNDPSRETQASDREFPLSERRRLLCNGPQSYKLDNLVFTNVSTAIDRKLGVCCDKGRRLTAQKNPHADLPDPWRPRPNQSR